MPDPECDGPHRGRYLSRIACQRAHLCDCTRRVHGRCGVWPGACSAVGRGVTHQRQEVNTQKSSKPHFSRFSCMAGASFGCEQTVDLTYLVDESLQSPVWISMTGGARASLFHHHTPQERSHKMLCTRFASMWWFQPRGSPGSVSGGDSNPLVVHAGGASVSFRSVLRWRSGSRCQSARWFDQPLCWFPEPAA
jgi:hypothetical protein